MACPRSLEDAMLSMTAAAVASASAAAVLQPACRKKEVVGETKRGVVR